MSRSYLCIDLKSFYASCECVERGLDPMKARLVVADPSRTEATVCLAVSPELKRLGVKSRCRLFEIPPDLDYITAPPRMRLYMDYSVRIYRIFMQYVAPEDIHVYSIDEAFLDVTDYLSLRRQSPRDFAAMILRDIRQSTGLTAACGIGTNLYLAKIALDILAKHAEDFIDQLDEESYCRRLWDHQPLTDFWRVGPGTVRRLERIGIRTMKEVAQADPALLRRHFGVDHELLYDHAWGRESTTIRDIKAYRPQSSSLTSGQVLPRGYSPEEGRIIVREMTELLALEMFDKGLSAEGISLHLGYAFPSGAAPAGKSRAIPPTVSVQSLCRQMEDFYDLIRHPTAPLHRVNIGFAVRPDLLQQYDLFSSPEQQEKERRLQRAILDIRKKHGANGILRAMDLLEGARTRERNEQIGGHRA